MTIHVGHVEEGDDEASPEHQDQPHKIEHVAAVVLEEFRGFPSHYRLGSAHVPHA